MKLENPSIRQALIEAKKAQARQLVERGYSLESTAHILALKVDHLKTWMADQKLPATTAVKFGRSVVSAH